MKELNKKKYVTLITIIILVMGIIGIINVGNIDLDKGKVKLKSASIEKLKSSVIESKGYEEITYPVLYELEKVEGIEERTVIIKGTLTKEENKYARFKEITSNNITSTVSENGRKIEIKIEKVKLGRQNKINLKIEINGAINETKIKPEIEIKEVSEKEYIKVKTEEIEVKTNSVTGLVQDEEGMSVSNLELSINKGNEEIRRTYTDENGRYVFSDVEEGKYTIKVEEENYELKEIKEVEVIGGITENIIVKKIKPYEIEVKKYISKIKLNNNGKEIEYEYGKLNKVNQTVKNLKNLSGEIEYKIEIKNTGEKSGEITKIEEEVTEGLKFKKEKNSEWEEKNGKIINRSLEGIKLKAGEEKEITLKLDIEKTDEARSYLQKVTAKGEVYQNVVYILDGKEYRKEKVLDGEKIEEPNIKQENFKGWYTDKNYTNKYNFKNSVTKDIILYGKIEESTQKYTVQYIDEGKIIKEEALEEGSIINAPEVTKEGHTFIGWYEGEEKYDVYEPITRNLILESKYEINKYKVRFINEDESVLQEETLDYGSIPTYKKETPTKTRTEEYTYEFDKWSPEITKVTSNQEYKATYKETKNKYTVTYINDGEEYHKETLEYGSVVTEIQDPTKEGYTFTGWYTKDNEKVSYPITITKNITLYSKYEINSYKVSYYNEGKKYIEDQKINYGENALKPNANPSKIGYTFKYWSLKENGEEYEFSTKITKDINLYAVYEINKYIVTYINEGTEYHKETAEYGSVVTSIQNPTKEGYTFTGWYTKDNEKVSYPITVTEDITLYSKYEINSYKVSYYNEGKKYIEDRKINYGENALKPNTNPSKIGYTFKYWSLKENGEEYEFSTKITKDITLYAVYEINKYTVTYINEGIEYHKETAEYGSVITSIQDPTKEGYTFTGWYTKDNEKVSYPITVTEDITLHSKYEINTYTVSFYHNNEKYVENQKVNYGESAVKPSTDPTKEDYNFSGWVIKGTNNKYDFTSKVTKDIELESSFTAKPTYTVTFKIENEVILTENVIEGHKVTSKEAPYKKGYLFDKWYSDEELTIENNFDEKIMNNKTIYGKYNENKHTVTYINEETTYYTEEVLDSFTAKGPSTNPSKEGYTFKYFSKDKKVAFDYNAEITEDTTLYAVYEINKYTVTYINEESEYHKEELTYGSKHEKIEDPFKTGYTFIGWYNENEEKVEYPITVTKDITLHSKYNINKYTVTYINEGAKYIEDQQINYKEKAVKPEPNPSKIGYTFKYWSLKENGEEYNFNSEITKDTTLYAVYNINKYTVTFKNYDGSALQEETLEYGALPKYKGEEPIREKTKEYTYTFKGWDKEITEVTNNQEYIATYTEEKNKYNVKFTNYDGSILQEETLEYGTLPVYKGEAPTREKTDEYTYTFKSWNKEITEVTDNEIYIAVYTEEKNKYTVIYMDGENEYTRKEVNYGETVSEEVISKDHNIYRGWTLEGNIYDFNIPVTKNITINSSFELVESPVIESIPIEWTKENVKVTISSNHNDYSYMYKIDDGEYQNYNGEFTVDKNCTVIAKSIKENVESEITTKEITNIDKVLPEIKELTEENITTKSFDIKVKGQDNESGLSEIRIYKNDELMVSYPYTERLNEEKEETYSLTVLEENTTYKIKAELIDKVGNINVSEEKEITTLKRVIVSRIIGRNNSLYESEEEYEPFESLEEAITSCGSNECTIEMVLNTNESVNVLEGQEIKLELNGKTVSGIRDYTIENSGELIIDNDQEIGSITNTNGIGIKNIGNGILQIGENEEPLSVSVAKPNIIGTTYGIYTEEETAKLKFYDGKIEGNVAIQGNVDDTPYLYNAKITNEGHQVATLSILVEAEARIKGGKYYTKLADAISETASGDGSYTKGEVTEANIMTNLVAEQSHSFKYNKSSNKLVSNNTGRYGGNAYAYIKLDLTDYEYDQELYIYGTLNKKIRSYGYAIITKSLTKPDYSQTEGRVLYLDYDKTSGSGTIMLEKGSIYYLHIGYDKDDYDSKNQDYFTISSITLADKDPQYIEKKFPTELVQKGEYGFDYDEETGSYTANNVYKDTAVTASSYLKVDLTNYNENQNIKIYVDGYSFFNHEKAYIAVTDSDEIPSFDDSSGKVFYVDAGDRYKSNYNVSSYNATLIAGKINYIHFGFIKNFGDFGSTDRKLKINYIITGGIGTATKNIKTTKRIYNYNEKVDTVEMLKNITVTSSLEIDSLKAMVLDLNGKTLSSTVDDSIINNSGNLTIIDSDVNKTGTIESTTNKIINNLSDSELTLKGGSFDSKTGYAIYNSGIFSMLDGAVINTSDKGGIYNNTTGDIKIGGGIINVKSSNATGIYNTSNVETDFDNFIINLSTSNGTGIENANTDLDITLNNIKINDDSFGLSVRNSGNLTFNDSIINSMFISTGTLELNNCTQKIEKSSLYGNIFNGTLTFNNTNMVYNNPLSQNRTDIYAIKYNDEDESSSLVINNSKINSTSKILVKNSTINNTKINEDNTVIPDNKNKFSIITTNNNIVRGSSNIISNIENDVLYGKSVIIGTKDSKVTNYPYITNKKGVAISGDTISMYDGTVTAKYGKSIQKNLKNKETGYDFYLTYNDDNESMNLIKTHNVAQINDKSYTSLSAAITAAAENDTINLLDNIVNLNSYTVSNTKKFSINLNSHIIRSFNTNWLFNNSGELTILDSSETNKGQIYNSIGLLFNNTGTVNLNNIVLNSIYSSNKWDHLESDIINNNGIFNFTKVDSNSQTTGNFINNISNGEFNISNSNIASLYITDAPTYNSIINDNKIIIKESKVSGKNLTNNDSKTLEINNSNVSLNIINNGKLTSIENTFGNGVNNSEQGTFISDSDAIVELKNYGKADLTNVIEKSDIRNFQNGNINIYSGKLNDLYNNDNSIMNIYDGTFNRIFNSSLKEINFYNGKVNGNISNSNSGTINIYAGQIIYSDNKYNAIENTGSGTINIGKKDGNVSVTSPSITALKSTGIYNSSTGKLNFYDGIIKAKTAISGGTTTLEDGYDMILENQTLDNDDIIEVKYLSILPVAEITSTGKKYSSLEEAFASVTEKGETIKLLREVTTKNSGEQITIDKDKNIVFDLNGYKVLQNYDPFIVNNGTLTIKDSSSTTTDKDGHTTYNGGITNSVGSIITNNGTFILKSGFLMSTQNDDIPLIQNNQTMNIDGGYISSSKTINNSGSITQNNGTIILKGITNNENSKYIINDGYISGSDDVITNNGNFVINNGTLKANSSNIILNKSTGTLKIYNGTITIESKYYNAMINEGNMELYGGNMSRSVSSTRPFIYNEANANLTIDGLNNQIKDIFLKNEGASNIKNANIQGEIINSKGTTNINSGNYSNLILNEAGTINIGIKGDLDSNGNLNISKTNPSITNNNGYALQVTNGTVNFYDGILNGTDGAVSGRIYSIEDESEIITENTTDKETMYLSHIPVAKIVSTNEEYYDLSEAISSVSKDDETIKLLRNYTSYNIVPTIDVSSDKNLTIDLNGYRINQGNDNFITNNGYITITDSSENKTSKIISSGNIFINNYGTVNIENVNIYLKNISLLLSNKNIMKLTGVNIFGETDELIENSGSLNMTNSTAEISKLGIFNTGSFNIKGGTYTFTKNESTFIKNNVASENTLDSVTTKNATKFQDVKYMENYKENAKFTIINPNLSGKSAIYYDANITVDGGYISYISTKGILKLNNTTIDELHNGAELNVLDSTINKAYNTYIMNVNGNTIINNAENHNIYNMNSGKITDNLVNEETFNLYGGSIISSIESAVKNKSTGTINIGTKDGNVSIEAPVITGKTYGVSNDSGKVNFYDGIVSGETGAFYGTVNEVEPGYKILTNKTDSLTSATLTLIGDDEKVAVLNGINFSSLQDAINSASDTDESVITLYKDVTFDSNITVPANKNIKLYLNGYTLNKGSYDFTGEGKITVIDGTSTNVLASIIENVKEVLNIGGIKKNIIVYEMDDGSAISSESTYKLYKDNEEVMLEEDAIGIYSVGNSNDEIRSANKKIYINELPKGKYKLIGDNNKEVKFEIDESGKIIGNVKENTKETSKIVSTAVAELIIMIQTGIEKVNYIMIILTLLVTISSLLYIVKKVNVKES